MQKILLFDFDGTIIDSLDVAHKAYNSIANKYRLKKFKNKKSFAKLYDKNIYESFVEHGLLKEDMEKFMIDLRKSFFDNGYNAKLFPGIRKALELLVKNNKIIIITSNLSDVVDRLLNDAKINFISEVIGGDKSKSKVEKIESVKIKYLNKEIYYIGDTFGDVLESKEAGIKTIAVTWGYHSKTKLKKAKPDYIVDNAEELVEILLN